MPYEMMTTGCGLAAECPVCSVADRESTYIIPRVRLTDHVSCPECKTVFSVDYEDGLTDDGDEYERITLLPKGGA